MVFGRVLFLVLRNVWERRAAFQEICSVCRGILFICPSSFCAKNSAQYVMYVFLTISFKLTASKENAFEGLLLRKIKGSFKCMLVNERMCHERTKS